MKKLNEIKIILKDYKLKLKSKYGIAELGIFGSYIKNLAREDSDLDLLVKFQEPISLLKFLTIENELSDLIGIKVDLVMFSSLKPQLAKYILKEVEMI